MPMGTRRSFRLMAPLLVLGLLACDGRRAVEESPLPDSRRGLSLERFEPVEALDFIGEWYPHDWRLHLFRALTDSSWQGRVDGLRRADSLHPGEPLIAYQLCLAYLDREEPEVQAQARPWLDKALAADPENAVLKVIEACVLLRENRLGEARALFLDRRRVPAGTFYYPRLEECLLGLFSRARHLNPYTLTQAVELYRRVPFPPFEKMIDVLYSVYLSPLPEHPYDIRLRGRQAADGLFRLGGRLRVQSYAGPHILSNGYEQESLGFMFQLKAAEFLTIFHRTFDDTAGTDEAFRNMVDVQQEYQAFMATRPWEDSAMAAYLDGWSDLIRAHPAMMIPGAVERARHWRLWRKAMALRYPARDDG